MCRPLAQAAPVAAPSAAVPHSSRLPPACYGPLTWTKKPSMDSMARRPFFSSFTFRSAKVSGSSARPRGSKASPAGKGRKKGRERVSRGQRQQQKGKQQARRARQPPLPPPPSLTGVQGVQALAGGAAVDAVALNQAHEHQLGEQDGDNGLGVDQGGVACAGGGGRRRGSGGRAGGVKGWAGKQQTQGSTSNSCCLPPTAFPTRHRPLHSPR